MITSYRTFRATYIAFLCLLHLVLARASGAQTEPNLVVNPTFEEKLQGWELYTPTTAAAADAKVRHGDSFRRE